jgi:hypothetical protein
MTLQAMTTTPQAPGLCRPVCASALRRISCGCIVGALLSLCAAPLSLCLAADQPASPSLEGYLKKLHYEPVIAEKLTLPGNPDLTQIGTHNKMFVRGELNDGQKPLFSVDTGWSRTALVPKLTRSLKTVAESGGILEDSFLGEVTNASVVIIEKLKLGRAEFFNQPARTNKLDMEYLSVPFDGVLGVDFLARNFCLLDCGGRRLYVRASKPTEQEKDALRQSLLRSGYSEFRIRRRAVMLADVEVNEKPLTLMVDTGSDFTSIDNSQAKRLSLSPVKDDHAAVGSLMAAEFSGNMVGVGKIGAHPFKVAALKSLTLGARTWKTVHVLTADLTDWGIARPGTWGATIQGFLGADFLKASGALIDFNSDTLWFAPPN